MAVETEKVRSELIIANVLLEVRRLSDNKISFFFRCQSGCWQRKLSGFWSKW